MPQASFSLSFSTLSLQHGDCRAPKAHVPRERQTKAVVSIFMTWLWKLNAVPSVTSYLLEREENQTPPSHGGVIREFVDAFKATMIGPLAPIINISPSCISEIQLNICCRFHDQDSVPLTRNHSPWVLGYTLRVILLFP